MENAWDLKTIIGGLLFLFLLYILFVRDPGKGLGGHGHDHKDDRGKDRRQKH